MPELPGTRRVDRATFTRRAALALVPGVLSVLEMRPEVASAKSHAITKGQRHTAIKTIEKTLSELNGIKGIVYQHDRCPPWEYPPPCHIFDEALLNLKVVLDNLKN